MTNIKQLYRLKKREKMHLRNKYIGQINIFDSIKEGIYIRKKKSTSIKKKQENIDKYNWDFIYIDIFMDLLGLISIFFLCFFFYKFLILYIFI